MPQLDLTVSALFEEGHHSVADASQAGKPFLEFRVKRIMRTAFCESVVECMTVRDGSNGDLKAG